MNLVNTAKTALQMVGIRKVPCPLFLARIPAVKGALVRRGLFQGTLERNGLVSYDDKARYLAPGYRRKILFAQEGQELVGELIERNEPMMVSRLGSGELACIHFYLTQRANRRGTGTKSYPADIASGMANPAGYFPIDDASLDAFAELYLREIGQADLLGVWFNYYENVICNGWCRETRLVELGCLEPFHFENPWSSRLAGKTVLVVHPFAASIQRQYRERRQLLFSDPAVLPDFELKTIRAVQSIAGSPVPFATWFDAYRHMCDEIAAVDFDLCIIGAGAYGLPLASFVKKLGRQAIHTGGATQLLFGIKGKRWEENYADGVARLFNEHWVRPAESETPENKHEIEDGCYW